jgi:hypothetical protein
MHQDRTDLKSDQENLAALGRTNKNTIICGLCMVLFFGGVAFQISKSWYTALIIAALIGSILLLLSLPWIIASIRGVPIYSNLPAGYAKYSLKGTRGRLSYGSSWWLDALLQALKRQ